MKVVILAGGLGTRLAEYTGSIPKPMVPIGGEPILLHIMNIYKKFGFKDFYIALGYKGYLIKKFFKKKKIKLNVKLIETGSKTLTGGRLKRLKKYIGNETFLLTYGDGVSNVNLNNLIKFHKKKKSIVTVTAVHPPARFGEIILKNNKVLSFKEKPQTQNGWINGGFFVMEPSFFEYIKNDKTILEKEPLENIAKKGKLSAFKHNGFWACMDTKRDKINLDKLCKKNKLPIWLK